MAPRKIMRDQREQRNESVWPCPTQGVETGMPSAAGIFARLFETPSKRLAWDGAVGRARADGDLVGAAADLDLLTTVATGGQRWRFLTRCGFKHAPTRRPR